MKVIYANGGFVFGPIALNRMTELAGNGFVNRFVFYPVSHSGVILLPLAHNGVILRPVAHSGTIHGTESHNGHFFAA